MTLYVTDLDGTLLNSRGKLKSRYSEMLNRLIRNGAFFTYATARGFASAQKVTQGLELQLPVITMNGAVTVNPATREITDIRLIKETALKKALDFFAKNSETPLIYTMIEEKERVCYLSHDTSRIKNYLKERGDDPRFLPCDSYEELFQGDIYYFCLISPKSSINAFKAVITCENGFGYNFEENIYRKGEYWLEIFANDVSKGNAALSLKEKTGADRLVVFGDNINDISLFRASDECYGVKNALPELKAMSNSVIGRCDSGGVPVFIEKDYSVIWRYDRKNAGAVPNKEKFAAALNSLSTEATPGIGTLNEKAIHKVLKYYFADEINHEAKIGGYYADIVGENGITEIQTGSFGRLNPKLECFLNVCHVTLVYPFERKVNLSTLEEKTGEIRKLTTNHKDMTDFFLELYRIRSFLTNPNLTICLVELEINKITQKKGKRKTFSEKIPADILSETYFEEPADYKIFLPENLPEEFTKAEFNKHSLINKDGLLLEILEYTGIVERTGKRGNSFIYTKSH